MPHRTINLPNRFVRKHCFDSRNALALDLAGSVRWGLLLSALMILMTALPSVADVQITGVEQPMLVPFDQLMVDFLTLHKVPGAAMAVTRNGRLIYARGFGWADGDARQAVQPGSLFRIASISKMFTSAAVLHLVEEGKIRLTDHPFQQLNLPPLLVKGERPDPRLKDITVLELLQHRGGFDRDISSDPMFHSVQFARLCGVESPAMPTQIIRVLEGRPLDFDPGTRYAYSNFGYCVLGRLIEQVTGQKYDDYVQQAILSPLGIHTMRLGRTLGKDRAPGEVIYYTAQDRKGPSVFPPLGRQVPQPYGCWCIEAMDSHGGWIASATDLVRFASALDRPGECPILKAESIKTLFERPPSTAGQQDGRPADVWYGCGWQVRDIGGGRINTWHTGKLDGTSTLLVRRWDGLDWAVLFNQDTDDQGHDLANLIDPLVHQAADSVLQWPEGIDRNAASP